MGLGATEGIPSPVRGRRLKEKGAGRDRLVGERVLGPRLSSFSRGGRGRKGLVLALGPRGAGHPTASERVRDEAEEEPARRGRSRIPSRGGVPPAPPSLPPRSSSPTHPPPTRSAPRTRPPPSPVHLWAPVADRRALGFIGLHPPLPSGCGACPSPRRGPLGQIGVGGQRPAP